METDDLRRISNAVRVGMVQGETMQTIARRIVGTATLKGRDGITQLTRNQVQSVTRTSVQHVANQTRREFLLDNADVVTKERYVATLDGRTTDICASLDGKEFKLSEGPYPPLHFNCRSIRIADFNKETIVERPAVPVTQKQLLREYTKGNGLNSVTERSKLPYGTKTKFDQFKRRRLREITGRVPSKETYNSWLKKQPIQFQEDVLGVTKSKLYRDGGMTLDKFVNRNGDSLPLSALARKHADVFRAAGLDPARFTGGVIPAKSLTPLERLTQVAKNQKDIISEPAKALKDAEIKYKAITQQQVDRATGDAKKDLLAKRRALGTEVYEKRATLTKLTRAQKREQFESLFLDEKDWSKSPYIPSQIPKGQKAAFTKSDEFIRKLIKEDRAPKVRINNSLAKNERAYHQDGTIFIHKTEKATTILHETIHNMEYRNPQVIRKTKAFLRQRGEGKTRRLDDILPGKGYDRSEITYEDSWKKFGGSPYTGKVYENSTEVLSMGAERLFANPLKFAKADPEFFNFVMEIFQGGL